MPLSNIEFFNFASKIIPNEFNGSPDKLQTFIDALNLLNENSGDHVANAVAFVKTRLTGKARDIISTETTLLEIITTFKSKIRGETSQSLVSKLISFKQNHQEVTNYATEMESLADKLKRAFVGEGVPYEVAERYSTDQLVRSLCKNANSEKVRIVMEAGTFKTVQEVITKFVSVNASSEVVSNVLYTRQNFQYGRRQRGNRGRSPGNYNRPHWNNDTRENRGHANFRNRGNGYRASFRGASSRIRVIETDREQGNGPDPQQGRLGDEM